MKNTPVETSLIINHRTETTRVHPEENLLRALRHLGYFSVKSGCDDHSCGMCTVLIDGKPTYSCRIKAVDVDGAGSGVCPDRGDVIQSQGSAA